MATRLLRAVARYGYVPWMLVGVDGTAMYLARNDAAVWILPLLLAAIVISFATDRIIPYDDAWNRSSGDVARDLAHALVNESLNLGALALLPLVASHLTVRDLWPHAWPFVAQVLVALLVLDAGITLAHYASHRSRALWRLHAVHHSVRRLYGFNGLMKHPVHQLLELSAGVAPLVLVGLPFDVAVAMAACVVVQLLLQHSNADYRVGPLGALLSLNEAHRLHHVRWAGRGDVNFGLFTLVWDRLLGTFAPAPRGRVTTRDLGIDRQPNYPTSYLGQLAQPFR